jgi:hypothetical protein
MSPRARGDLLEDERQRQGVEAGAAEALGHRDAVAAEVGKAAQLRLGEVVALVPRRGVRRDLGLHVAAHGVLHRAMVVAQQHARVSLRITTAAACRRR